MSKRKNAPSTDVVEPDFKKLKKEEFFEIIKKRKGKTFKMKKL